MKPIKTIPTYKSKLNDKQILILKIVYKFRFTTTDLIALSSKVTRRSANNSLSILAGRGLLHKRYDSSYRLPGRPASYNLTPKATKYLRDEYGLNDLVLHAIYKDRTASQKFVSHCLGTYRTYLDINEHHPDTFSVFTRSELADFDYFPVPSPNLYLKRIDPAEDQQEDYMLDIFEPETELWIIKKRIRKYLEHYEEYEWINDEYPQVVLLVANESIAKKLNKYIRNRTEELYIEEDELIVTAVVSIEKL